MNIKYDIKESIDYSATRSVRYDIMITSILLIINLILFTNPVQALGDFKFDFAAKITGPDNFTKHWSNIYPPDPRATIIIYSYTGNISFKRMSAISYVYVT